MKAVSAEEVEKKKKTFLELLKELLDILRKPGYYGAMKEIENNLNELSYANALTNEVLDNLISMTGEVKGNLKEEITPEKAQELIDKYKSEIAELKDRIADTKTVRQTIEGLGEEIKDYALYERNGKLYLSKQWEDGSIGKNAFPISVSKEADGKITILTSSTASGVEGIESGEYKRVPLLNNSASKAENIMHTIINKSLSPEEQRKYYENETAIENLNKNISKVQAEANRNSYEKLRVSLETKEGRFKTFVDENNRFVVADTDKNAMLVFDYNKSGKLLAKCYDMDENQKPIGDQKFIAGAWQNTDNGKIAFSKTSNKEYDISEMFNLKATQEYLLSRGLPIEHIKSLGEENIKTPNSLSNLTKSGERNINNIYKSICHELSDDKGISVSKQISKTNGSFIRFTNSSGEITQINFDSNGKAANIEYDKPGDGKGFVMTHKVVGDLITPEMQAPLFCQQCVQTYAAAAKQINDKTKFQKKEKPHKKQEAPAKKPETAEKDPLNVPDIDVNAVTKTSPQEIIARSKSDDLNERIAAAKDEKAEYDVLNELANDDNWQVRAAVASRVTSKAIIAELVTDDNVNVRKALADRGEALDILVSDKDINVLESVAKRGNETQLEALMKNISGSEMSGSLKETVLCAVAARGFHLDELLNSDFSIVREAVAKQGYGLDELCKDKDENVRAEVARHGYGLKQLLNDESEVVKNAASAYLSTIPNDLTEKALSAFPADREAAAMDSRANDSLLTMLSQDPQKRVRIAVAKQHFGLGTLMNDPEPDVRVEVVKQRYGLNELINDSNAEVRAAVAKQHFGLEQLMTDKSEAVRATVASNADRKTEKSILEALMSDKSAVVRTALAERGYGLDTLVSDSSPAVRAAVAKQGEYYAKLLSEDGNEVVKKAVEKALGITAEVSNEQNTQPSPSKEQDNFISPSVSEDVLKRLKQFSGTFVFNTPYEDQVSKTAPAMLKDNVLKLSDGYGEKEPVIIEIGIKDDAYYVKSADGQTIHSIDEINALSPYLAGMLTQFAATEIGKTTEQREAGKPAPIKPKTVERE